MFTWLIVWMFLILSSTAVDVKETMETTKEIFENAIEVFEHIDDGDLVETSKGIAKWGMPLISSIGKFAKVFLSQVESESKELTFMKDQFQIINDKMDFVDKSFEDVKKLIDWNVIKIQYGKHELNVNILKHFIQSITESPPSVRHIEIKKFLLNYDHLYDNAAENIFLGFVNQNMVFSENLIVAIRKYTKDHRYRIEKFFMGNLKLILKCLEVETFYINLKNFSEFEQIWKVKWEERLNNLTSLMKVTAEQVLERWEEQSSIDLEEFNVENGHLSHKDYAEKLYTFLIEKYSNRLWQVVVYDPLDSDTDHAYKICKGTVQMNKRGHNVLVSSLPVDAKPFNKARFNDLCSFIPKKLGFRTFGPAHHVLYRFVQVRMDCMHYNQLAVVIRSKSPKYSIGPVGRVFDCQWSGYYNKVINIHKTFDIIIMG